jgi:hypothetical protein
MSIKYFTVPDDQQQISKIAHEMELRNIGDAEVVSIESGVHGLIKIWYRDSKGPTAGPYITVNYDNRVPPPGSPNRPPSDPPPMIMSGQKIDIDLSQGTPFSAVLEHDVSFAAEMVKDNEPLAQAVDEFQKEHAPEGSVDTTSSVTREDVAKAVDTIIRHEQKPKHGLRITPANSRGNSRKN